MDYKNVKSDKKKEKMGFPQETDIDYENDSDEKLKKMGRQVED